ncbi:DNA methylase [Streptomyces fumigatiscleroticus]|nr:DNA methylase [Streptomyces fumigatiscleroticus]
MTLDVAAGTQLRIPDPDYFTDLSALPATRASLIEKWFPARELSQLIAKDRRVRDPAYAAHRWWARRPPALLRALLLATALPADISAQEFWDRYASEEHHLAGLTVYDPFMGGGSTLVEAQRLGASVMGSDVDPMSVRIVRSELTPIDGKKLRSYGHRLLHHLRTNLSWLYPTEPQDEPLHYFSIAEVQCPACEEVGPLYRNLILVRDPKKVGAVVRDHALTVFCPHCWRLHDLDSTERKEITCCGKRSQIMHGTFRSFAYHCSSCGKKSTHRELKTGVAKRRIVAVEETQSNGRRRLRMPSTEDLASQFRASQEWQETRDSLPRPEGEIRATRSDERPRSYGITRYEELFTPRQLLVLGHAFQWIRDNVEEGETRKALELAISNCLSTNNKLCGYATDYGRLSALFSVRGYSLPALTVELNPLHGTGGRGTIAACIERVAKSDTKRIRRHIWDTHTNRPVPNQFSFQQSTQTSWVDLRNAASASPIESISKIDVAVFDPPYFDFIAYDELSEFHRSWFGELELAGEPLLPKVEDPVRSFAAQFAQSLEEMVKRARGDAPFAFTYHSANPDAWKAVGLALDNASLAVTALWPVRSDGHMGHHSNPGNCEWDVVVVCRPGARTREQEFRHDVTSWVAMLEPLKVNEADIKNFEYAIKMAQQRFAEAT